MVAPDELRCRVELRVLEAERDAWHAEAERHGLTLSEWLRRAAALQLGKCPSCGGRRR